LSRRCASGTIEISKFLDEDATKRPPPPPLLKAYVRRSAAYLGLERYEEATADLKEALEMAPHSEVAEIRKLQNTLKQDVAAAKREAVAEAAAASGAAGGGAAGGGTDADARSLRTRVRELLTEVQAAAAEAAAAVPPPPDASPPGALLNKMSPSSSSARDPDSGEARAQVCFPRPPPRPPPRRPPS